MVASLRRLAFLIDATPLDSSTLVASLRTLDARPKRQVFAAFARALDASEGADWERELVLAVEQRDTVRPAMLAEVMTELDFRTERWIRVPRVAASLSSSFGFLLATMSLRVGLAGLVGPLDEERVFSVDGAVLGALDVAVVGLVGAACCIAVQYRARVMRSARLAGVDRLVEVLERLAEADGGSLAGVPPHASVGSPQPSGAIPSPVV